MAYRVLCPACGRVLSVSSENAGQPLICNACGNRIVVPASPPDARPQSPSVNPSSTADRAEPARHRAPSDLAGQRRASVSVLTLAVALLVVAMAVGLGTALWLTRTRGESVRASKPGDARSIADLLALKSDAESLAINGKLAEAHEKYRELQRLAIGRDLKDATTWDLLERARQDQDRVYDILLAKQRREYIATAEPRPTDSRSADPATQPSVLYPPDFVGTATTAPATRPVAAVEPGSPTTTTALPATTQAIPTVITPPAPSLPPVDPRPRRAMGNATDSADLSDAQIAASLQRGVDFLIAQFKNGELPRRPDMDERMRRSLNALCVYALLEAGRALPDERLAPRGAFMNQLIEKMKEHVIDTDPGGSWQPITYGRSLRAAALSVYNRAEDKKALLDDTKWLIEAEIFGCYTYDDRFSHQQSSRQPLRHERQPVGGGDDVSARVILVDGRHDPRTGRELDPPSLRMPQTGTRYPGTVLPPTAPPVPVEFPWDNSNSQYGLLGTWSAAEVGGEVPEWYWLDVEKHWVQCQLNDGEWSYRKAEMQGTLAMTCAGIASLMVTQDWLDAAKLQGAVGREPFSPALAKGLAWLEKGDNCLAVTGPRSHYLGYDLYGLERVGLASGFKYFGTHDWYRELSKEALLRQWPTGAWGAMPEGQHALVDTSYIVLFLARGRHPVVMNKLRFDGFWANRPRDLANLTRFAARSMEKRLNWQVVGLQAPWYDWLDSPVLYLASHQPPALTPEDVDKIRKYVEAGGLLFTHADANSEAFNKWVPKLAKSLFPDYELKPLPDDHELYQVSFKVRTPHPKLLAIGNGSRLLMVHSPVDLATSWQQRAERSRPENFELGTNLFLYASGKANLRNRLSSPYVPAPTTRPTSAVLVARLQYPGLWDPEPAAWERFANVLQNQTGVTVVRQTVGLVDLKPGVAPIAHLTGTFAYSFTPREIDAVRAYVEAGGVLLVDSCGGAGPFTESAYAGLLTKAFPDAKFKTLSPDEPPLFAGGASAPLMVDASKPVLRPYAAAKTGMGSTRPEGARIGKGLVVFSHFDLTTGLLAANTWGVLGYEPDYAQAVVRNIVVGAIAK